MSDQRSSAAVPIPLTRIMLDPQYQPRAKGLSESHVRVLLESDPAMWTAAEVAPNDDGTFVIIDGAHRFEAAQRLKLATLPCIVREGAGYPQAVAANIRHGLPLSIADRKEAAQWWATTEPGLSFREIGRRVSLSDKTVRKALASGGAESPQTRRAVDPLDRWLLTTARLDRRPSTRDVSREIADYDEADRSDIAKVYAAVGRALIEAATPYLEGRG